MECDGREAVDLVNTKALASREYQDVIFGIQKAELEHCHQIFLQRSKLLRDLTSTLGFCILVSPLPSIHIVLMQNKVGVNQTRWCSVWAKVSLSSQPKREINELWLLILKNISLSYWWTIIKKTAVKLSNSYISIVRLKSHLLRSFVISRSLCYSLFSWN